MSYSFKLQFYVNPEDRWYPDYRNPRAPTATTSTGIVLNDAESRPLGADAHISSDETTHSTDASSASTAASPGLPDRPSTPSSPAATEHADSRHATPRQQMGDGFSVVPGHSRRLQRERPFSVAPDPMWNSSQEIRPYEPLATGPPPPPYVCPPTYAEVALAERIETIEEVVPTSQEHIETIEIHPASLQPSTLNVQDVSVSSSVIPRAAVAAEEAEVEVSLSSNAPNGTSHALGPSWTFYGDSSSTPVDDPYASGDEADSGDDENELPTVSEAVEFLRDSEDTNPPAESELSEKARGKKRMRDEDYDEDQTPDLGEGCSSGSGGGCGPSTSSCRDRDNDGEPDRKRMKTDKDRDTRINTDRLEGVDPGVLIVARAGLVEVPTNEECFRHAKKLKEIEKLYRTDRLLL